METGNAARVTSDGRSLDEARAAYRQVLEHDPTDIQAMLALGRIERRLGNDRAACNALRAAAAIDPNNLQGIDRAGHGFAGFGSAGRGHVDLSDDSCQRRRACAIAHGVGPDRSRKPQR